MEGLGRSLVVQCSSVCMCDSLPGIGELPQPFTWRCALSKNLLFEREPCLEWRCAWIELGEHATGRATTTDEWYRTPLAASATGLVGARRGRRHPTPKAASCNACVPASLTSSRGTAIGFGMRAIQLLGRTRRVHCGLTFDMRGDWRPQAGKRPLDGRVRPQSCAVQGDVHE